MKRKSPRVIPAKTTVQELVVQNGAQEANVLPLVLKIIKHLFRNELGSIEYQDVVGEGLLALARSMDKFDPSRGIKLTTFAYRGVQGAVKDLLMKEQRYGERYEIADAKHFARIEAPNHFEAHMSNRKLFLEVIRVLESRCDPRAATVLVRLHLEEKTPEQVARELRTSVNRVLVLENMAAATIRQQLGIVVKDGVRLVANTDH